MKEPIFVSINSGRDHSRYILSFPRRVFLNLYTTYTQKTTPPSRLRLKVEEQNPHREQNLPSSPNARTGMESHSHATLSPDAKRKTGSKNTAIPRTKLNNLCETHLHLPLHPKVFVLIRPCVMLQMARTRPHRHRQRCTQSRSLSGGGTIVPGNSVALPGKDR